jgi:hypothetical protein
MRRAVRAGAFLIVDLLFVWDGVTVISKARQKTATTKWVMTRDDLGISSPSDDWLVIGLRIDSTPEA